MLRTARSAGIPIFLLDLGSPLSLAALDYLDNLSLVGELAQAGQAILPITVPGTYLKSSSPAIERILNESYQDADSFALHSHPFLFVEGAAPGDWSPSRWLANQKPGVIFYLAYQKQTSGILPNQVVTTARWQNWRILPIPKSSEE